MYNAYLESDLGILEIVCNDTHLLRVNIVLEQGKEKLNEICKLVKNELNDYFNNNLKCFNLPLELVGNEFQKKVWLELLKTPYGEVISYQELANRIGNPKGVRAVARAVGANNISIIIPCHRVIGSNKTLTGYSGGIENKITLLSLEGHAINLKKDMRKSTLSS
ncbi:MAG: methylated-DNA--[protein]-cysteine S-methyltransferase [Bacilli bacterium]|nr:methylated-DNA--[protein]-cysteine S-methyltransferase [Bacilli bacterium]MDD4795492.1 methylated-DNA--[protein]-cysteine S-methyltransferase [Bacilli bacterium]